MTGNKPKATSPRKVRLTLAMRGGPIEIDGFTTPVAGLAVHREAYEDGTIGRLWSLTHVPSGLRITGYLPSRAKALRMAEGVGSLTNWNRPYKGAGRFGPKGLGMRVQRVRLAVLGGNK